MRGLLMPYLLAFSRLTIGLVFAWSSIGKILKFAAFEQAIVNFKILPGSLVRGFAFLVLTGEIAVVLTMLLGGTFLTIGFSLAILLLLGFSIALLSVLARKIQTSCHCFGPSERPVSPYDVLRNVGFIGLAVVGWAAPSTWPGVRPELGVLELAFLGLMAAAFTAVWTHLKSIIELLRTSWRGLSE